MSPHDWALRLLNFADPTGVLTQSAPLVAYAQTLLVNGG